MVLEILKQLVMIGYEPMISKIRVATSDDTVETWVKFQFCVVTDEGFILHTPTVFINRTLEECIHELIVEIIIMHSLPNAEIIDKVKATTTLEELNVLQPIQTLLEFFYDKVARKFYAEYPISDDIACIDPSVITLEKLEEVVELDRGILIFKPTVRRIKLDDDDFDDDEDDDMN